ncbi:dodecin family protein [Roseivirga echinicomitans]|uniref:Dodecin n=1 Tax=Roseivirga echinicomitans TaxID=296218 RepID=A0A150XVF8_9BACT|nr:dodecin family protein [Roseivirga echinicomitans]KYG82622.1 dodecin [Roseivirga echinicomitans]
MGVHKVIEVMAFSTESWEDAAQEAINGVAKNVRNIESIYIQDKSGKVVDNRIVQYRINAKITFRVE